MPSILVAPIHPTRTASGRPSWKWNGDAEGLEAVIANPCIVLGPGVAAAAAWAWWTAWRAVRGTILRDRTRWSMPAT